jgi:hypothetical protein
MTNADVCPWKTPANQISGDKRANTGEKRGNKIGGGRGRESSKMLKSPFCRNKIEFNFLKLNISSEKSSPRHYNKYNLTD